MYCEHISSCFFFFLFFFGFFFFFFFLLFFFLFCFVLFFVLFVCLLLLCLYILQAFKWLSRVICYCMQMFNLVSICMQIKLIVLSIQTFVGQHKHAISRFYIISCILSDD